MRAGLVLLEPFFGASALRRLSVASVSESRLLAPSSAPRATYHAIRWASSVCAESEGAAPGEDAAAPDG
jgi:hypothetical protein